MSLPTDILYLVRNRKTGEYIVPRDGASPGDTVTTSTFEDGEVPNKAKFSLSIDDNGLYALKANSDRLFIADAGDNIVWQKSNYQWDLSANNDYSWNVKLPKDSKFVADSSSNVILMDDGSASETHWDFIATD